LETKKDRFAAGSCKQEDGKIENGKRILNIQDNEPLVSVLDQHGR